jgi:anti-sigma factor RsiW
MTDRELTCHEARLFLPAYLDDELSVGECARMGEHLAGCAECRTEEDSALALRAAIRGAGLHARPDELLAERVRRAVRAEARREASAVSQRRTPIWQWAMAAGVAVLSVAAGVGAIEWQKRDSRERLIARDVVADHLRSLRSGPLIEVASSDRHTVKPWFQGKVDFAPLVPDLSRQGWVLEGGRVDYVDGRSVAALVYRRALHAINVFTWSSQGRDSAIQQADANGYQILHWDSGGMTWWVISDLNRVELTDFAHALRGR